MVGEDNLLLFLHLGWAFLCVRFVSFKGFISICIYNKKKFSLNANTPNSLFVFNTKAKPTTECMPVPTMVNSPAGSKLDLGPGVRDGALLDAHLDTRGHLEMAVRLQTQLQTVIGLVVPKHLHTHTKL